MFCLLHLLEVDESQSDVGRDETMRRESSYIHGDFIFSLFMSGRCYLCSDHWGLDLSRLCTMNCLFQFASIGAVKIGHFIIALKPHPVGRLAQEQKGMGYA